jgi:hypothetical protein
MVSDQAFHALARPPRLTPAEVKSAARYALEVLRAGAALRRAPTALGPLPTREFQAALRALAPTHDIWIRCATERCNGRRLIKWRLDPERGAVVPVHRVTKDWTGRAPAWLDRANDGKGRVTTAADAADGLGTLNFHCDKCGKDVPVKPERRLELFLNALVVGQREIWL